ncbi:hypothetical protein BV898_01209 [Hypsibius exemplaris]|uniref:Uncharacterized protein n=1 Tax=Hypsibius exemplaris TaxID=2072580 RepID=A0A1W0XCL5_HYPEX|nr:hypothetical protein BV898_01209 [Hypsibius exemplaris]
MVTTSIDYRKFSNRVCNWREAGFISIGFAVAVAIVAAILLSIFFATKCADGELPCKSSGTTCRPAGDFCNGKQDCPLGEDEWECYPSEFYLAFRTNTSWDGELGHNMSEQYNNTRDTFQADILAVISEEYGNSTVEVFRLRPVTEEGLEGSEPGSHLAVDSFVKIPPGKKVTSTDIGNYPTSPDNITAVVERGLAKHVARIDPRTDQNVTTGVAVVLRAPSDSTCRAPAVYCINFCKPGHVYQYGTTKGCPECACSEKPLAETA